MFTPCHERSSDYQGSIRGTYPDKVQDDIYVILQRAGLKSGRNHIVTIVSKL